MSDVYENPLAEIEGLIYEIQNSDGDPGARKLEFSRRVPPAVAKYRRRFYRQLGLMPVPVGGSPIKGLKAGYFMRRLPDGTVGYLQRRTDDCLQASIATCLQIPVDKVPDLQVDRQLQAGVDPEEIDRKAGEKMRRFMDEYGVRIWLHPSNLPSSGRWIGVVSQVGLFTDHCLLMSGSDVLFDTMNLMDADVREAVYGHTDIDYAITFE